jgi:putative NIF3 family GTP cyclohydrolase 1 type 2
LTAARIALVSPHTAFDSAGRGVNQHLAEGLELRKISPLIPCMESAAEPLGTGRKGVLERPLRLAELAARLSAFLGIARVGLVGSADQAVQRVAVACGSGAELLDAACDLGCHCFVTGEARFHTCLDAQARGVGMLLAGHYASERFAVEILAGQLASAMPGTEVWASVRERDPIEWIETVDDTA